MPSASTLTRGQSRIFWGCFIALVTCAFGFIVRTQVIGEWQAQFNLSETEKGDILGVGFWPFAFSIFVFSLVIDRIGYGRVAFLGCFFHVAALLILLTAQSARALYWGTFVFALSNGTVEAYINPTVTAMFPRAKVKWLNLLHAGWAGGMVIAGILAITLSQLDWHWRVGLTFIPTLLYSTLLIGVRFPLSERVAAGVSYREMLQDFGGLGAFVAIYLIALQVCEGILKMEGEKFLWPFLPAVVGALWFGGYVKSKGRWLYFFLLLVMFCVATTELGIDSWISDLMGPEMHRIGLSGGWVLVYTAAVMTVLRSFAGPVSRWLTPPALLACGSALAIVGLFGFSRAAGIGILAAATIYGLGKAYFWSTTLAMVSEQFPRGGAVTMNCIGGVGMLSLSVGMVFLGNVQDRHIAQRLQATDAIEATHLQTSYLTQPKRSIFGNYLALDQAALASAPALDVRKLEESTQAAKKSALATAAFFPSVMLVFYLGLWTWFKRRGGYRRTELAQTAH